MRTTTSHLYIDGETQNLLEMLRREQIRQIKARKAQKA